MNNMKRIGVLLLFLAGCVARPMAPVTPAHFAYVTNEGDNTVMQVDLEAGRVLKTLPTGKVPHALVFNHGNKLYVNNRGERSLTVIDTAAMTVLKTIPLPARSIQFALSPDGKTLAVGYRDALKITLIDTATDTILRNIDIGADQPGRKLVRIKHPFWSRDGRFVYAGDNLNRTVVKIDAANRRVVATIPIHATVHHFLNAPDGTIYVFQGKNDEGGLGVTVLDAASDRIIKTIPIPLAPGEKAFGHHGKFTADGRFCYVCNEGGRTLAIIDTATLTVVKTLQVGQGAGHTFFSRDGKYAFVICHHDNVVSVIDTATQQVIKNIPVGRGKKEGHSGYIATDGSFYMLNAADGTINRINGKSLTLQSQIKIGTRPMIMVIH